MSLLLTLALLAAAVALAVFAGWRGAQPSQPHRGVRMVPWRFVMVLACAVVVLLVVHVAALLGVLPPPR
jgi:putative copper export protein